MRVKAMSSLRILGTCTDDLSCTRLTGAPKCIVSRAAGYIVSATYPLLSSIITDSRHPNAQTPMSTDIAARDLNKRRRVAYARTKTAVNDKRRTTVRKTDPPSTAPNRDVHALSFLVSFPILHLYLTA